MMDLSRKNIIRISESTGFIKDNVEKMLRLSDILETVFSSPWKDKLALKGGTAINLFYQGLPRLSVDIDLDYLGEDKEGMKLDKGAFLSFISSSLGRKGYVLSNKSKRHYALDSFVFSYKASAGNLDNIKLDVNYMDRRHILPLKEMGFSDKLVPSQTKIVVLDPYELYGSKISALLDRCKARDVYDVYRLSISGLLPDLGLLRKCAIFYNCIGGACNFDMDPLKVLDGLTEKDVNRQLRPLLSKRERFSIDDAMRQVKEYVSKLLLINEGERSFIASFRNKIYKPELLFLDEGILDRIKDHPMALWRVRQ